MDRPSIDRTNPAIFKAYNKAALEATKAAADAGLGRDLIELVNTRVSQVNGCVRCLSIHAPAARKHGVTQDLLDLLPACLPGAKPARSRRSRWQPWVWPRR